MLEDASSEDEAIDRSVTRHGWHAIAVDDGTPPFLYTCGLLSRSNHPELIVLGLDRDTAFSITASIVGEIQSGTSFAEPVVRSAIIPGLQIAFRPVDPSQHELYLGYAMGHARRHRVQLRAVQVLWPDREGRFPFDVDCDIDVRSLQPRLELRATSSELRTFR